MTELLSGGSQNTLMIAVGLVAICVVMIGFALFSGESEARKRKRVKNIDPTARAKSKRAGWSPFGAAEESARDRLRMLAEEQKKANSRSATLRVKLQQAGLKSSPAQYLATFYFLAVIVAGGVYFYFREPLASVGVAVAIGFFAPSFVLNNRIFKRVQKYLEVFPNALDILVRGVKSGLPVNESLKVAADELPDPVGVELRQVVANVNMGVAIDDALKQMHERVPSNDVSFFRTVLAIQKQSGGNLAEALGNLSNILRERKKLKKKVVALSAEARMSAIIIGALPIIVGCIVYLMKPDYIGLLFTNELGKMMLIGAAFWMTMGVLVMRWMIKFEI